MEHLAFCVWLISSRKISSRVTHDGTSGWISYYLKYFKDHLGSCMDASWEELKEEQGRPIRRLSLSFMQENMSEERGRNLQMKVLNIRSHEYSQYSWDLMMDCCSSCQHRSTLMFIQALGCCTHKFFLNIFGFVTCMAS